MKKLTVMVACAALLLGGGCFLKANNANLDILKSNTEASTANGALEAMVITEEVALLMQYGVEIYQSLCSNKPTWVEAGQGQRPWDNKWCMTYKCENYYCVYHTACSLGATKYGDEVIY